MNSPITPDLISFKRKWIESIYDAVMTVTVESKQFNPDTYFDEAVTEILLEEEPCRIVEQGIDPTKGLPRTTDHYVSIMCAPEHEVPPGARIHVSYREHELDFYKAGESKRYSDHQTFEVELWKEGKGQYV